MSVSFFISFAFLLMIHKVSMQSVRVEGVIGQTAVLPCSVKQTPQYVLWQDKYSRTVCDIINGEAYYDEQDPAYRDRVKIFLSEIGKGDFSIELSNVKESDAGTYTCHVPNIITVSVELTVTDGRDPDHIRETGASKNNSADGLQVFLLGCALLYSLVF